MYARLAAITSCMMRQQIGAIFCNTCWHLQKQNLRSPDDVRLPYNGSSLQIVCKLTLELEYLHVVTYRRELSGDHSMLCGIHGPISDESLDLPHAAIKHS